MEIKDKKKLCNKIFWKIFLALLISFFALYVSAATGYYENGFSNAGIAFSNVIEECIENGVQNIFGFLNSVFDG